MFLRNLQQKAATMHQQGVRSALNQKQNLMGTMQRRGYQYYGSKGYATGFERMILDKFNAIPILPKISLFALLGGLNLACYGLS